MKSFIFIGLFTALRKSVDFYAISESSDIDEIPSNLRIVYVVVGGRLA